MRVKGVSGTDGWRLKFRRYTNTPKRDTLRDDIRQPKWGTLGRAQADRLPAAASRNVVLDESRFGPELSLLKIETAFLGFKVAQVLPIQFVRV